MIFNKDNFYSSTKAIFRGAKRPKRNPDYVSVSSYSGKISSEYWYTPRGVYRCSDHWSVIAAKKPLEGFECGRVSTCLWTLKNTSPKKGYDVTPCGFCRWEDFHFLF